MIPILTRNDDWVVVAKPHGQAVHRSAMVPDKNPTFNRVRKELGQHVWLVHRLDRATSGCLVVALNKETCATIQSAMREDGAQKTYLALVRGNMLKRGVGGWVETPMKDPDTGIVKEAATFVEPLFSSDEPRCTVVLARPRTGRFHQVRRHLRDLSHPVLGDSTHGDTRVNRVWREEQGLHRLALHCLSLDIPLPDGRRVEATCPVPRGFARVLHQMPWWHDLAARLPSVTLSPANGRSVDPPPPRDMNQP